MPKKKLNYNESLNLLQKSGVLNQNMSVNELLNSTKKLQESIGNFDELADITAVVHKNYVILNVGDEKEELVSEVERRIINRPSIAKDIKNIRK